MEIGLGLWVKIIQPPLYSKIPLFSYQESRENLLHFNLSFFLFKKWIRKGNWFSSNSGGEDIFIARLHQGNGSEAGGYQDGTNDDDLINDLAIGLNERVFFTGDR